MKDDNPYKVLGETVEEEGKGTITKASPLLATVNPPRATKDWVNQTFGKAKENEPKPNEQQREEEKDSPHNQKKATKNNLEELDDCGVEENQQADDTKTETGGEPKRAIVVYTWKSEEITPLRIQHEPTPTKDVSGVDNKIDKKENMKMTQVIIVVSTEGDLSLTQVGKLKAKFNKTKR